MSPASIPNPFGFVLSDVARLWRAETDRRIAETGLAVTPGEARALAHVARAGCARQIELAESMGVEPMTMSGYLDKLEAHGLIERRPDPVDRRAKLVTTTEAAQAVLQQVRIAGAATRADILRFVTPDEWEQLSASVNRLRDVFLAMRADGGPRGGGTQ